MVALSSLFFVFRACVPGGRAVSSPPPRAARGEGRGWGQSGVRNQKQKQVLLLIADALAPHPNPPHRSLRSRGEGDVSTLFQRLPQTIDQLTKSSIRLEPALAQRGPIGGPRIGHDRLAELGLKDGHGLHDEPGAAREQ